MISRVVSGKLKYIKKIDKSDSINETLEGSRLERNLKRGVRVNLQKHLIRYIYIHSVCIDLSLSNLNLYDYELS